MSAKTVFISYHRRDEELADAKRALQLESERNNKNLTS